MVKPCVVCHWPKGKHTSTVPPFKGGIVNVCYQYHDPKKCALCGQVINSGDCTGHPTLLYMKCPVCQQFMHDHNPAGKAEGCNIHNYAAIICAKCGGHHPFTSKGEHTCSCVGLKYTPYYKKTLGPQITNIVAPPHGRKGVAPQLWIQVLVLPGYGVKVFFRLLAETLPNGTAPLSITSMGEGCPTSIRELWQHDSHASILPSWELAEKYIAIVKQAVKQALESEGTWQDTSYRLIEL